MSAPKARAFSKSRIVMRKKRHKITSDKESCPVTSGTSSEEYEKRPERWGWVGICVEAGGSFWHRALTDGCWRQQTDMSLSCSASGAVLAFQTHSSSFLRSLPQNYLFDKTNHRLKLQINT